MVELLLSGLLLQVASASAMPMICVDKIRGEQTLSTLTEDALASALLSTKRVRVTENCAKADYTLKGSVVERADLKSRSEGEATGVASAGGAYGRGGGGFAAMGAKGEEALSTTETKRSVTLIVKLVRQDGDIPFAGTQDSSPSKNRSAVSEAIDKLTRELLREVFPAAGASAPEGNYRKIR